MHHREKIHLNDMNNLVYFNSSDEFDQNSDRRIRKLHLTVRNAPASLAAGKSGLHTPASLVNNLPHSNPNHETKAFE